MSAKYSISPNGEKFALPKPEDYKTEFENIKKRVKAGAGQRPRDSGGHGSGFRRGCHGSHRGRYC